MCSGAVLLGAFLALERTVGAQLAEFDFRALAQRARRRDELEVFRVEAAAEAFTGEPRVNA